MNKKLLAVAVAGVLAAPAAAFAQSSVTISGFLKGGFEGYKLGNFNPGGIRGATPGSSSQTGVVDDSSRIIFNMTEDLGGGLRAIGQVDMRVGTDSGAIAASGNNHIGLQSRTWGRFFVGRQDLHYFNRESELTVRGSLRADSISILAYAGVGLIPVAGATRTPNVVHYTTPNWGGFTLIAAYSSTGATGVEGDIGATVRKGKAWHLNPNLRGSNYQIGYSYWDSKPDAPSAAGTTAAAQAAAQAATANQRGHRFYGSYNFGGFKIGLAWDRSKLRTDVTGALSGIAAGTELSNRTAWSVPMSYTWGPHSIHAHFDKARNDKAALLSGLDTKASMFAVSYGYDLSKRTSAAFTYARINNGSAAAYQFFTNAPLALGAGAGVALPGEDPRLWAVTLRHAF